MPKQEKRILLIDADVIAFRNTAAIETRTIKVYSVKSGNTKSFKNRTELKTFVKAKGLEYKPEDFVIRDVAKSQPFDVLTKTMPMTISKLQEFTWADETELHIGSDKDTFRQNLPLPRPYKDRDGTTVPEHLEAAKEWLSNHYKTVVVPGVEADDTLTIRAYEEKAKGNYPIIATIDKDAYQTQGCAVLNLLSDPYELTEIPDVGSLVKSKSSGYKGNGLMFLAYQTLVGDPVDNYKSYELSKVKYGPEKAAKALSTCTTPKSILECIIKEYKLLYPEPFTYESWSGSAVDADWEFMLQLYWRCAYMQRSWNDQGNFWDYALQYGLNQKGY